MLVDLFKPAWKSSSVEKRLKAVTQMDASSSENQKILAQLAADDENDLIRLESIKKLTSIDTLHEMSIRHSAGSAGQQAEKRLNELMATAGLVTADQCADLLKRYPELAVRLISHIDIPSVRNGLIQSLPVKDLLPVLAETVYSDSRQLIAEKLTDIEMLESARKLLRGKDKNAERLLKTKIDEFRAQQRVHAENLATVEKLIEEVEYLSSHDWLPEFKAKVPVHRKQWDMLDFDIQADSIERYQKPRQVLDNRYDQQILIEQIQLSQQQLIVELESFVVDISSKDLPLLIETLQDTQARLQQFTTDWQLLAEKSAPDNVAGDRYQSMNNALISVSQLTLQARDILQKQSPQKEDEPELTGKLRVAQQLSEQSRQLSSALKKLHWPVVYGELKLANDLQAQLADWHKIQQEATTERQQKLDGLHKKISSIFRFSRNGNLARAKQFCERVDKGLQQFSGKDRLALDERFEEARKTMGEMGDWKNFATEPKYIELCEAMEQLTTSKKHPDKISKEMKDLQQQWKSLGNSDISDKYWPRFKLAADQVYQPCAEFFEERHKTRQTYLEQRQQFVEQLQQLLDGTDWQQDPDYKSVQSAVRSISDHFTAIKDVERKAGQKQWKQFSKIKDDIYSKLDVAYDANIALKQQLIKQTELLAQADAIDENLAKLKTLQIRWKQIGITRRNEDQKAWKEFKKQGDIVYHNVQQLRQGKREQTDQQLNAYRVVIKDIQKLARTAEDLAESDQQFSVLQEKYGELPELPPTLPEKLIEGIQRDYEKACAQFDDSHSRIIKNKHAKQIEMLRHKAILCEQQEALGSAATEQQLEEISKQWDAIQLQDKTLSDRIEARRNSAQTDLDRDAIAAQRKMLCIQLEIAKGVESPAEDKALRMQYQLEQMNKSGLGHQIVNSNEQLENMELDWLCMPGTEQGLQKVLNERFQQVFRTK